MFVNFALQDGGHTERPSPLEVVEIEEEFLEELNLFWLLTRLHVPFYRSVPGLYSKG